jgi:protein-tyrosine-phosphatase
LRAILVGVGEEQPVPTPMLERVAEFLRLDPQELEDEQPPQSSLRRSSLRISTIPPERMTRILLLGRSDAVRVPMLHAVASARWASVAEVRAASIAPSPVDARVVKVLRQAGFDTDKVLPRPVTVDDLTWADLVVTITGTRDEWAKFLPRSIAHEHQPVTDPSLDSLREGADPLDVLRHTLRNVERVVGGIRLARPSRFPSGQMAALKAPGLPNLGGGGGGEKE